MVDWLNDTIILAKYNNSSKMVYSSKLNIAKYGDIYEFKQHGTWINSTYKCINIYRQQYNQ